MDSGLVGPAIVPLPESFEFDTTAITTYIATVLNLVHTQDAYGILAGVNHHGRPVIPTLVFGLPLSELPDIILPPPSE